MERGQFNRTKWGRGLLLLAVLALLATAGWVLFEIGHHFGEKKAEAACDARVEAARREASSLPTVAGIVESLPDLAEQYLPESPLKDVVMSFLPERTPTCPSEVCGAVCATTGWDLPKDTLEYHDGGPLECRCGCANRALTCSTSTYWQTSGSEMAQGNWPCELVTKEAGGLQYLKCCKPEETK